MLLSQKQNEYIRNANRRWNLKIGAVRSGKSYVDIVHTIPSRLREGHGKDGLNVILGVSKETIERNVLEPMRERYTHILIGNINSRNIARICGENVYCLGAEKVSQVSKIQGSSIKYCYGDEIAKWNQEVFAMLQSRLDKPYSRFDGACNPEYPNHWLKQFIDQDDIDAYIQKYTLFDNPYLDKNFVKNLCKEYAGTVYYQRYVLGEWALAEGLVYPMFSEEEHVIDEIPWQAIQRGRWYVSIDYGTVNPCAMELWTIYNGVAYLVQESYYDSRQPGHIQRTDEEHYAELERLIGERKIDKIVIDPSAASFKATIRKHGKFSVWDAQNDVINGIRFTATALKSGRIKIHSSCVDCIREFQSYMWDSDAGEDTVIKENDHCLTGDTLVDTMDGPVPIKDLVGKTGKVWSYNGKKKKAEIKRFFDVRQTQAQAKIYKITLEDGRVIRCTGEHRILTDNGYMKAKYLKESDCIVDIIDSMRYNNHGGDRIWYNTLTTKIWRVLMDTLSGLTRKLDTIFQRKR